MLRLVRATAMLYGVASWCQPRTDAYQTAVALVQQQQYEQAVALIPSILAEHPRDVKTHNLMGIALSGAGRREEANLAYRKALEIDSSFVPALKNLAVNELALRQYDQAGVHFQQALKGAPQDPLIHLGLGEVAHAAQRHEEALASYQKSGDLYLKDPAVTLRYAGSCLAVNRRDAAREALLRLAPAATPRMHFEAGVLLAQIDAYEPAVREFRSAEPGYPDPYEVGYNLSLAYLKAGQGKPAGEVAERLIAAGHKKAEILNLLSQAYESQNRTKEAYDALRAAIESDPRHESSYLDLMILCLKHENSELGLEISEIALKSLPESERIRLHRGVAMALLGRFEEAEREFVAATQAAPKAPLPYVALALVRLQLNRLPEAIDLLRKRRQANTDDYLANWFLAEAISRTGAEPDSREEQEAIAALHDAVRTAPKSAAPRTLLGKFLSRRGDLDGAASAFEAALALDPDDTNAAYQLAVILRKRGDTKRAQELFAKVSRAKAEDREQFTRQTLVKILRENSH